MPQNPTNQPKSFHVEGILSPSTIPTSITPILPPTSVPPVTSSSKPVKSPVPRDFKDIQFYSLSTAFMEELTKHVQQLATNYNKNITSAKHKISFEPYFDPSNCDPSQILIALNPPEGEANYSAIYHKAHKVSKKGGEEAKNIARSLSHNPFFAILVERNFFEKNYPWAPKSISIDFDFDANTVNTNNVQPSTVEADKAKEVKRIRQELIKNAGLSLKRHGGGMVYNSISNFIITVTKKEDNKKLNPVANVVPVLSKSIDSTQNSSVIFTPMQNVVHPPMVNVPLMGFDGQQFFFNADFPWVVTGSVYNPYGVLSLPPVNDVLSLGLNDAFIPPVSDYVGSQPFTPPIAPSTVLPVTEDNKETNNNNNNSNNIQESASANTPMEVTSQPVVTEVTITPPKEKTTKNKVKKRDKAKAVFENVDITHSDDAKAADSSKEKNTSTPLVIKTISKKVTNNKASGPGFFNNRKNAKSLTIAEIAIDTDADTDMDIDIDQNDNNNNLKRKELDVQENSAAKKSRTDLITIQNPFEEFNKKFSPKSKYFTLSPAGKYLISFDYYYQERFVDHKILALIEQKPSEIGFYIITNLMQAVILNNMQDFDRELNNLLKEENRWAALNLPVLKSRSNQEIDLFPLDEQRISVLTIACMLGRANMAIKLLQAGANDYKPSLINAIKYARVDVIEFMYTVCKKAKIVDPATQLQADDLKSIFSAMPLDNISEILFTLCRLGFFADKNRLEIVAATLARRNDWTGLDKFIGPKNNLTAFFSIHEDKRKEARDDYVKLSNAINVNLVRNHENREAAQAMTGLNILTPQPHL